MVSDNKITHTTHDSPLTNRTYGRTSLIYYSSYFVYMRAFGFFFFSFILIAKLYIICPGTFVLPFILCSHKIQHKNDCKYEPNKLSKYIEIHKKIQRKQISKKNNNWNKYIYNRIKEASSRSKTIRKSYGSCNKEMREENINNNKH